MNAYRVMVENGPHKSAVEMTGLRLRICEIVQDYDEKVQRLVQDSDDKVKRGQLLRKGRWKLFKNTMRRCKVLSKTMRIR